MKAIPSSNFVKILKQIPILDIIELLIKRFNPKYRNFTNLLRSDILRKPKGYKGIARITDLNKIEGTPILKLATVKR